MSKHPALTTARAKPAAKNNIIRAILHHKDSTCHLESRGLLYHEDTEVEAATNRRTQVVAAVMQ